MSLMTRSALLAVFICPALFAASEPTGKLSKSQRIERNCELAKRFFDGYVNLPKLGYVDSWQAEDYAENRVTEWFYWSDDPRDFQGSNDDFKRRYKEVVKNVRLSWRDSDRDEYEQIVKVLPDFTVIPPFRSICDETGCAIALSAGGHDSSGEFFAVDEALFFWTNEYGKIVRIKPFDDHVNLKRFAARMKAAGLKQVPIE